MNDLSRGERFKDARTVYNVHGKQTMQEVSAATGVAASCIKDLEDDTASRSVGYDKVASLAWHYGVSVDWLIGRSDVRSTEPTLQAACQYTGLSEKAIENLHALCRSRFCDPAINGAVNSFLELDCMSAFFNALQSIQRGQGKALSIFQKIDKFDFSEASRTDIQNMATDLQNALDYLDLRLYKFQEYAKSIALQMYETRETITDEMKLRYLSMLNLEFRRKWDDEHTYKAEGE